MTLTRAVAHPTALCASSLSASSAMQSSGIRPILRGCATLDRMQSRTIHHAPLLRTEGRLPRDIETLQMPQLVRQHHFSVGFRHDTRTRLSRQQRKSPWLEFPTAEYGVRPGLVSATPRILNHSIIQNTMFKESGSRCGIYNRARRKGTVRMLSTSSIWSKQDRSAATDDDHTAKEAIAASSRHISPPPSQNNPIPPAPPPGTSTFTTASTPPTIATSPSTHPAHITTHSSSTSKVTSAPPVDPSSSSAPFLAHLPDLTSPRFHRPTKEELLAAATGFWSRLRVRFKWFSIRSLRPFNSDDISAFFSWILVGHVIWILVGTTTFFSLLILTLNTVFAQGVFPFC